jgi:multisubunit Na+/H+ antiporter MnhB subunit
MPHYFTQISLGAATVLFVFALLLKWKPLRKLEPAIPWMLLTAGIGFGAAFLTGWVHWAGGFTKVIPIFGGILMTVTAFVLLFIVLYDLWPKHPTNRTTEIACVLLPAFGGELGGVVGVWVGEGLSWLAVAGSTILAKAIGV